MTEAADRAFEMLRSCVHGNVERNGPIAPLTSYGLGGPAAVLVDAATQADLVCVADARAETNLPLVMVGRGSNLLISDRGFPGIAARLGAGFRWTRVDGSTVDAGASVPLPTVAVLSGQHTLTGLEFAVAIPASVGGAVRMNAGAHGHAVGEVLDHVDVFSLRTRSIDRIPAAQLGLAYRTSDLPAETVIVAARFALSSGDATEIQMRLREAREWRRATQPLNLPNAGSVFKNPPEAAAGKLIEDIVGKGTTVGGARVSEVHANFIVASPGARANDVYTLIRMIQRRVAETTGIQLETEVRLIGDFEEVEDEAPAR